MNIPPEDAALTTAIQKLAAKHVAVGKTVFGIEFDYSEESLQKLDEAISKHFPHGNVLDSTIEVYGAYVGETVRRTLGGVWAQSEDL
jgi:hypothetical protein